MLVASVMGTTSTQATAHEKENPTVVQAYEAMLAARRYVHTAPFWVLHKSVLGKNGPQLNVKEIADLCLELGLAIDLPPESITEDDGTEYKDLWKYFQDRGVRIACVMAPMGFAPAPFMVGPADPDPEQAKAASDDLKRIIRKAAKYGIENVLSFTGYKVVGATRAAKVKALQVAYGPIIVVAGECGVTVALECLNNLKHTGPTAVMEGHDGYFGYNPDEVFAIVVFFEKPKVFGVAADWYHLDLMRRALVEAGVFQYNSVEHWKEKYGKYIVYTHTAGVFPVGDDRQRGEMHLPGQLLNYDKVYNDTTNFEIPRGMHICHENLIKSGRGQGKKVQRVSIRHGYIVAIVACEPK